jgi:hypothetical protein
LRVIRWNGNAAAMGNQSASLAGQGFSDIGMVSVKG